LDADDNEIVGVGVGVDEENCSDESFEIEEGYESDIDGGIAVADVAVADVAVADVADEIEEGYQSDEGDTVDGGIVDGVAIADTNVDVDVAIAGTGVAIAVAGAAVAGGAVTGDAFHDAFGGDTMIDGGVFDHVVMDGDAMDDVVDAVLGPVLGL
jgi:hypothetical protein